jgi:putative ABC transport system ATP-binding protein
MILAERLSKTYRTAAGPLTVLRDVDLHVAEREMVAVLGPSGSGKSTLLGLLAGLDEPTTGRVTLAGQHLGALTEDDRAGFRARHVGFVFQTFHLLPTLTALENVRVPLELLGRDRPKDVRARAERLLDRVGLADRADHYPAQLSGGEQQRVALARAFSGRPRVLFADEPTGNLDAETGGRVVALLEELHREGATTLVLVTHDPALAERAGRVIRLAGGALVADSAAGAGTGAAP